MNIGEILSKAWQIIWKHKVLWIFGILAGCANGGGGGGSGNLRMGQDQMPPEMQRFADQFAQIPEWQLIVIGLVVIIVLLLLFVLAIFLSTMGRIGLIRGASQVDQGETRLQFGSLFSSSMPYFWRVFGLNLLVGLAAFVLALLVALIAVLGTVFTLGLGLFCIIPLLCLLVPVGWLVGIIIEQATISIVLENKGIMDALRRGWEVFRANVGNLLLVWLILGVISLVLGFVLSLPIIVIAAPAMIAFIAGNQADMTPLLLAGLCLAGYIPVMLVLNGILAAFVQTSWTLTFMRLTTAKALEPVVPEPLS
jgi:hypothetical protein